MGASDFPGNFAGTVNVEHFTKAEVEEQIRRLKPKQTMGPDCVPSFIVRDCAAVFSVPLTTIFNLSIASNRFPMKWKIARITPIHKKGDRSEVSNYRPVSVLSNFSKVFEMVLFSRIYPQVKSSLSECQHGFVRGRSTATNLVNMTQYISENIDANLQTDVIYTDFSKAFDKLDHGRLLAKLPSFGFGHSLVCFFKSYLLDRSQFVQLGGSRSNDLYVTSGVPQGSVMGPLLFNLYVNDISNVIDVNFLLYADDLKIFHTIHNIEDSVRLQGSLDKVYEWSEVNRLPLNISKCVTMTFSRKTNNTRYFYNIRGTVLNHPDTVRDLGIHFESRLTFISHTTRVVNDAFKMLGFIVRNSRDFVYNDTLKRLFDAFVRSRLEYCMVVWRPVYRVHAESIERVQRRFLKFLCFREDGAYPPRGFQHPDLLNRFLRRDLESRFKTALLVFLHKLIHGVIDCQALLARVPPRPPCRDRRVIQHFYLPAARTDVLKYSPVYKMCKLSNLMAHSVDVLSCNVSQLLRLDFADTRF